MESIKDQLAWINEELDNLKKQGLFINIRTIESPMGTKIKVDGRWVSNFCSNNYLGLAKDSRKFQKSIRCYNFSIRLQCKHCNHSRTSRRGRHHIFGRTESRQYN